MSQRKKEKKERENERIALEAEPEVNGKLGPEVDSDKVNDEQAKCFNGDFKGAKKKLMHFNSKERKSCSCDINANYMIHTVESAVMTHANGLFSFCK